MFLIGFFGKPLKWLGNVDVFLVGAGLNPHQRFIHYPISHPKTHVIP
jgi:hypothetical protein